jgi:hypothetical protein
LQTGIVDNNDDRVTETGPLLFAEIATLHGLISIFRREGCPVEKG